MGTEINLFVNKHTLKSITIYPEKICAGWAYYKGFERTRSVFGITLKKIKVPSRWLINGKTYDSWHEFTNSQESKHKNFGISLSPDDCIYYNTKSQVYVKPYAKIRVGDTNYIKYFYTKESAEKWAQSLITDNNLNNELIIIQ